MIWWTAVFEEVWTAQYLPSNATPWERIVDAVDADLVARDPIGLIAAARSVEDCPAEWRPYLAAERSVDEFDGAWSEGRQKAVIGGSLSYHRVLATPPAFERALAPLGYDVTLVEWFEVPGRPPWTHRLRLTAGADEVMQLSDFRRLQRIADQSKPTHTRLEVIEVARDAGPATVHVGGFVRMRHKISVFQNPPAPPPPSRGYVYVGAGIIIRHRITIPARH